MIELDVDSNVMSICVSACFVFVIMKDRSCS